MLIYNSGLVPIMAWLPGQILQRFNRYSAQLTTLIPETLIQCVKTLYPNSSATLYRALIHHASGTGATNCMSFADATGLCYSNNVLICSWDVAKCAFMGISSSTCTRYVPPYAKGYYWRSCNTSWSYNSSIGSTYNWFVYKDLNADRTAYNGLPSGTQLWYFATASL